jgi:hypothetical protein
MALSGCLILSLLLLLHLTDSLLHPERRSRRALLGDVTTSFLVGSITFRGPTEAIANDVGSPIVPGASPARFRPVSVGEWSPSPQLETNLGKTRLVADELKPMQKKPFSDQELYYAPFLFGSWNVKATLKRKIYPYGVSYVPSNSLIEGSPRNREEQAGSTTSYELHYFSTLANTLQNQMTVQLGLGVPQSKIIADRAFNTVSISNAYKQLTPVQQVEWDPTKDPTRLTLDFGTQPVAQDMRPLGPRRGEVYITSREAEFVPDNENVFACCEQSRSVTLATRNVVVSDTESTTEFQKVSPNLVRAVNRIAVYLTPNPNSREGILWQQVDGKAVAFFDYELEMRRKTESFLVDGQKVERACVATPKEIIQCE